MKAEIDLMTIWECPSCWDVFMTSQAQREFLNLAEDSINTEKMLRACEIEFEDFDYFTECLHHETTEWLKSKIGWQYFYEDEEDDEEEEDEEL